MNPDPILHDLEIMSRAVHYNGWIFSQLNKYIGQRIIEVGAGIGNYTQMLLDRQCVIAIDDYEPCVEYMKKKFSGYDNIIPLQGNISSEKMLKLREYDPDTVVCINVLEHVQDDITALSHMHAILQPGGALVLLVPALRALYGSIDRAVGHFRRYTRKELREKLLQSGFLITDIYYMNSLALLGWFYNSRVIKRVVESPAQVFVFDRFVVPWLKILEGIKRPPLGLSLIVVGQKIR